ncbi:thiamine ABC transporter substrate-binding protein [Haloferacaceae archaeon DSL9]
MKRRTFLRTAGAGGAAALLAGCTAEQTGDSNGSTTGDTGADPDVLRVATYQSFVDAPSAEPPGPWVKDRFEEGRDAELEWRIPENGVRDVIERVDSGLDPGADLYLGLTTDDLIQVDEALDDSLFAEAGDVDGRDDVTDELRFDPNERAVPFDTGYVCLVYDETETEAPLAFDELLEDEHSGHLLAQSPAEDTTGRAFFLHTVHEYGTDGYLDYWRALDDNDVRVLGDWGDSYAAYEAGERPMVVSYSTDQVYANASDADMSRHQLRFLNDEAYANPEGMATFAAAEAPDLAREFMSFVLTPEAQGEIAERNVVFPATETADLSEDYVRFAHEPDEPVLFTYDELAGNVDGWVDEWTRQVAAN